MSIKIIRTRYSKLKPRDLKWINEHEQKLEEKGMTIDDEVREIFKKIGVDIDKENIEY